MACMLVALLLLGFSARATASSLVAPSAAVQIARSPTPLLQPLATRFATSCPHPSLPRHLNRSGMMTWKPAAAI